MTTTKRGTDFSMVAFMFKNPTVAAAARQDERNRGLPYASVFAGANGCDAEIVSRASTLTLAHRICSILRPHANDLLHTFFTDTLCTHTQVYEFKPESSGGLTFGIHFALMAWSQEATEVSAWTTSTVPRGGILTCTSTNVD